MPVVSSRLRVGNGKKGGKNEEDGSGGTQAPKYLDKPRTRCLGSDHSPIAPIGSVERIALGLRTPDHVAMGKRQSGKPGQQGKEPGGVLCLEITK